MTASTEPIQTQQINGRAAIAPPVSLPVSAQLTYQCGYGDVASQHVFLTLGDIMTRYGCGKTTACALVNEADFPGEVAPRRWRLDHVLEHEDAKARTERTREPKSRQPVHVATEPIDDDDDVLAPRPRASKASR